MALALALALAWPSAGVAVAADRAAATGAAPRTIVLQQAESVEPRAFGWRLGDRVERRVVVDASRGLRLDARTLPRAGLRGGPIELRELQVERTGAAEGLERHVLRLHYQLFQSPVEPQVLELPGLVLGFVDEADPTADAGSVAGNEAEPHGATDTSRRPLHEVRIDAWPLVLAPLAPAEPDERRGLGSLQPDAGAPRADTTAMPWRVGAELCLASVLGLWLLHRRFGLWRGALARRPFARCLGEWRRLRATGRSADWQHAVRRLHRAFDETRGQVLFERDIDRFVQAAPRFADVRPDIAEFFARSRQAFFDANAQPPALTPQERRWLLDLGRRLAEAERRAS